MENINVANLFGILAGLLSLSAFFFYWVSIVKGQSKPSKTTWWIWTLLDILLSASYWAAGARETLWLPVVFGIGSLVTAILSLKYGYKAFSKIDVIAFFGAIISALIWPLVGPFAVLWLTIIIDTFGALPTIKKAYVDPKSENLFAWFITGLAVLAELVALALSDNITISIASFPIYIAVIDLTVVVLLYTRRPSRVPLI